MNRLSGALAVLLAVIIIVTAGFIINTNTADYVKKMLSESMDYANNGDIQNAKISLEKAKNKWDSNMETMLLFVSHGKLDQIEETINVADSYINNNEIALYLAQCKIAQLLIDHFKNIEYPNINNIF